MSKGSGNFDKARRRFLQGVGMGAATAVAQPAWGGQSFQDAFADFFQKDYRRMSKEEIDELENYLIEHGIEGIDTWTGDDWRYYTRPSFAAEDAVPTDSQKNIVQRVNVSRQHVLGWIKEWLYFSMDTKHTGTEWYKAIIRFFDIIHVGKTLSSWSQQAVENGDLVLDEQTNKPIKVTRKKQVKSMLTLSDRKVSLTFKLSDEFYSLSGTVHSKSGIWEGLGTLPDGSWAKWAALKKKDHKEKESKNNTGIKPDTIGIGNITYPMMAYGWDTLPSLKQILIRDITIWTNEDSGILEKTDLLIRDGKIKMIGDILDVVDPETVVINGAGKHLTPGIIDEHSHIAISRGVNESGQASSAEVSVATVVNSDDINIYRQL